MSGLGNISQEDNYKNLVQISDVNLASRKSMFQSSQCSCQASVLFVDDIIFNLMAAVNIFQKIYPFKVDEATSGAMAIDLIQKTLQKQCNCKNRTYKLILMDIQMPQMEGTEATEKILKLFSKDEQVFQERMKQENNQNDIKFYQAIECSVVALSSYTGDHHKNRALKSGMKDYINKPLAQQDLIRIMDQYFFPFLQDQPLQKKHDEADQIQS